jgi:hypothetical protein
MNEKSQKTIDMIKVFCPTLEVNWKKNSKFHKLIGWFLSKLGNKEYMESYLTTIGQTISIPSYYEEGSFNNLWLCLMHEGKHAIDAQKLGNVLYGFLYLFPQSLGILGIFASLVTVGLVLCGYPIALLWILLSLLFLLPIPSIGRAIFELRAYKLTQAVFYWSENTLSNSDLMNRYYSNQFCTSAYYFMWPFRKMVDKWFINNYNDLKENKAKLDPYEKACKTLCQNLK